MDRLIAVLASIGLVVSSLACLWAIFHSFMAMSITLGIVDMVLSLVCWRMAIRRARRRQAWTAYLRRYQS